MYEPADPTHGDFPLRDAWFLEVVLHHWAKYPVIVFGSVMLAGFWLSFTLVELRPHRRIMLFLFVAMLLGAYSVSALQG